MTRSKNSRKGSKKGNYKCSCCLPKMVREKMVEEANKREGRPENAYSPNDKDYLHPICDWDGKHGRH